MASSFTRDFGRKQGRIAPSGTTAPDGTYVFCLGYDDAAHFEELQKGDFVEVAQTAALTVGTKLLRVLAKLRAPAAVPSGLQWVLSLRIDNVERARHVFAPGALLRTRQLSANVSKISGSHKVSLRLQLEDTAGSQFIFPSGVASSEAFGVPTVTT